MGAPKSDAGSNDGRDDRPAESGDASVPAGRPLHFIEQIIEDDLRTNKWNGRVHTRFPPEPNGYLHIGHAKSICLNFGLAAKYGGLCNLRFDDTNPTKEEDEYVESIQEDVRWLGFDWEDRIYYASDYFEQLYEWAVQLIKAGQGLRLRPERRRDARVSRHVDRAGPQQSLSRPQRGGESRSVPADAGRRVSGRQRTLRAKIDMASPNLNMRDPVMYRILHATHHRTGDKWCIYPMYDFTHGQSDSIERITHSICTLEFENHRPLYDWYCQRTGDLSPAADRVRAAQFDLHGDEQAEAADAGQRRTRLAAGTIRACRRSAGCGGAATRPRRFAVSATGSAWRSSTARSTWPCWKTPCARI